LDSRTRVATRRQRQRMAVAAVVRTSTQGGTLAIGFFSATNIGSNQGSPANWLGLNRNHLQRRVHSRVAGTIRQFCTNEVVSGSGRTSRTVRKRSRGVAVTCGRTTSSDKARCWCRRRS
jgi:hypothetical protein